MTYPARGIRRSFRKLRAELDRAKLTLLRNCRIYSIKLKSLELQMRNNSANKQQRFKQYQNAAKSAELPIRC
jgi:hypothetical protein